MKKTVFINNVYFFYVCLFQGPKRANAGLKHHQINGCLLHKEQKHLAPKTRLSRVYPHIIECLLYIVGLGVRKL